MEKKILINGTEYNVVLTRFDDDIDVSMGATYHGYYITITGNGMDITARKYDDENEMLIQEGLGENDQSLISALREIAKQLFDTTRLKLLIAKEDPPYKEI